MRPSPVILLILSFTHQISIAQDSSVIFDSKEESNLKADEYYNLGNDNLYDGNHRGAIIYYDEAIRLRPKESTYYIQRAQAKELANKKIGALIDYEIAIQLDPENPTAYFKRGLLYHHQKNYKMAIVDFSRLLEGNDTKETKGIIFKGIEINEGGEAAFDGIVTINKMKGDIYNARANSLEGTKKYNLALKDYDSAISINSKSANFLVNRGVLMLQLKDTVDAALNFRKALNIDGEHYLALYNLSLIAGTEERKKLNAKIFGQGQFAHAYSNRGFEKFLRNDFVGALNDYDSALFLRPKYAEDLMSRGLVKMKLKKYLEANEDFKMSLEKDRSLIKNYVHLGNTYQKLDDFQNAIDHYQLYLTLHGDDARVYYNKGIAEYNSDKIQEACVSLKKSLSLGEEKAKKVIETVCK